MSNLWNTQSINSYQNPVSILEEQKNELLNLTNKKVSASITTTNDNDGNFIITFLITSPVMPNYTFKVFTITCPPVMYPLSIVCDENIGRELGFLSPVKRTVCNNYDEFLNFLTRVLGSNYISKVVSSIMTLANSYIPL